MQRAKKRIHCSPENCANCSGEGLGSDQKTCSACNGKGRIQVVQPSIRCPRCHGTGKPETSLWNLDHCAVCLGTGWTWTEFHLAELPEQSRSAKNNLNPSQS